MMEAETWAVDRKEKGGAEMTLAETRAVIGRKREEKK